MNYSNCLYAKHPIVKKLVEDAQESVFYEGTQYVWGAFSKVIGYFHRKSEASNALISVKLKSVRYRTQQVGGVKPFMSDLPEEKLEEIRFPFANTGVDYFGTFELIVGKKPMKRWCYLFMCLQQEP